PGQVFTRTPQLKISKAFQLSDVKLELAVGVARPPQMQAGVPEGQGGIRASLDSWSATHTTGAISTSKQPLSLALSGTVRRFVWPETPTSTSAQSQVGWGLAANGFIPVIPVSGDTSWHSLALVGEYAYGNGIGDQYSSDTGGLTPAANPAGMIDPALAVLDGNALRLINWQSYRVGLEYYLPILDGRVWLSTNYAHMDSGNLAQLVSATAKSSTKTAEDWVDGNLFVEAMPGLRLGIEYAYLLDRYADNVTAVDHRVQLSAFYMF
ncbi:MAG: hypothetical protein EBR59_10815, partial [Methylococcaceae bacterium]|nr:hypothetical protein [Methylococcaceae bacterium]